MRIALFNDTGKHPHVGCRAVSSGHDRMLAKAGITVAYRSYYGEWRALGRTGPKAFLGSPLVHPVSTVDAVVVNGEGSIHHTSGRHLIEILSGAQRMGVPTYLVNAVLQDVDSGAEIVLKRLADCTVRDARSSAYLTRMGVRHRVVFDSMLEGDWSNRPAKDLTDKVVVTDYHGSRSDVGAALRWMLKASGYPTVFYPLNDDRRADRWRHAVADLRSARLVVTGRHHGVCLAAMAGVPFVAFGGNTWKVEGLLSQMPGRVSVCDPKADLREACERAMAQPEVFAEIQRWVLAQRPLTTFAGLLATKEIAA